MNYKIKRKLIKIRQKRYSKKLNLNLSKLNSEHLSLFKMVEDVAKKNNSNIVFDPYSSEIIISLPKILILIDLNKITVQNSKGFFTTEFHPETMTFLNKIIYKEAHKERRKLIYQAKKRLMNFLDTVTNEI